MVRALIKNEFLKIVFILKPPKINYAIKSFENFKIKCVRLFLVDF
jgi:hypothetical protein